jgi:hypothetical protein
MDALDDALLLLDETVIYEQLPDSSRRLVNQAVFGSLIVIDPDTIYAQRTPLYDEIDQLSQQLRDTAPPAARQHPKTPRYGDENAQNDHDPDFRGRGSYIMPMAERAGFEPAMEL